METEELNEFQQVVKSILEKQRSPWLTPMTPYEKEVYKSIYPELLQWTKKLWDMNSEEYKKKYNIGGDDGTH